ncbi:MotA/TolQ/ExbB proton channel family protein [Candidatus Liberibacter americanus]|uniref:Biopolymer transport protein n=1 Tax=Candidatus Liberibacter americanus str. Sao Paulo TaxID=1261131 RepID=U6B5D5_9HYPH|nr:MotA/TolQ/ExbB proton channel family protein [Candidatus Liberibacter americanus]AHA28160.1 Biopolymer transport protein [Candidatus Liberibacter americanus str. Sao Paulo]EMS35928.1 tolQ protein [Candidatus Liberibacter americanus PW_SP]
MSSAALDIVDVNIFSLFIQTGIAIKFIIILLIFLSIFSWSIIIEKVLKFAIIRQKSKEFDQIFWSGQSLEELYKLLIDRKNIGSALIFISAMCEWKKSFEKGACSHDGGVQGRIDRMMNVAISRELEDIVDKLGILSAIASISFLIGLLGIVLGLINSLQIIAAYRFTSIVVVLPEITGALISIMLGLLVSITSTFAYNILMENVRKFSVQMEEFADEFYTILSRQIKGNSL